MSQNIRIQAILVLQDVFTEGYSLSESLKEARASLKPQDAAWLQALCYGVVRDYGLLETILKKLLQKPIKSKEQEIHFLLLIGLYQLRSMQIPPHAAVNETVAVAKELKKDWAVGMVNGVLRNFIRQQDALEKRIHPMAIYSHPQWLIQMLQSDWPKGWKEILAVNQEHPPMTVRINISKTTAEKYSALLGIPHKILNQHALILAKPVDVSELPHFAEGWVSVQDASAQLAAGFLDAKPGMRVLDACAAPGGKTAHLLETIDNLDLLAIDQDAHRLEKVTETLKRLEVKAEIKCAEAGNIQSWWDGKLFDRILLDAPCSATGVIRRHPDIKWLRRAEDVPVLVAQQLHLLTQLWSVLKPGGCLLYATCSVLKAENENVIKAFLTKNPDATVLSLKVPSEFQTGETSLGVQIFPGVGDGFYYAVLTKVLTPAQA